MSRLRQKFELSTGGSDSPGAEYRKKVDVYEESFFQHGGKIPWGAIATGATLIASVVVFRNRKQIGAWLASLFSSSSSPDHTKSAIDVAASTGTAVAKKEPIEGESKLLAQVRDKFALVRKSITDFIASPQTSEGYSRGATMLGVGIGGAATAGVVGSAISFARSGSVRKWIGDIAQKFLSSQVASSAGSAILNRLASGEPLDSAGGYQPDPLTLQRVVESSDEALSAREIKMAASNAVQEALKVALDPTAPVDRDLAIAGVMLLVDKLSLLVDDPQTGRKVGYLLMGAGASVARNQPFLIHQKVSNLVLDEKSADFEEGLLLMNTEFARTIGMLTSYDVESLKAYNASNLERALFDKTSLQSTDAVLSNQYGFIN